MRLSLEFALQSGHTVFSGFLLTMFAIWWLQNFYQTKLYFDKPCSRARNSCLQTRKMRVEIQFCELKIWALEKSCEFDISSNTKSRSWSQRCFSKSTVKGSGNVEAPRHTDSLSCRVTAMAEK